MRQAVDRISRHMTPWAVLAAAMVLSVLLTLYFGRGTTFSGDEFVLIVTSPGLDPQTALQPHGGHLLLIPRLVYAPLLELFGLAYLPYRVLTVLSVCLAVGLLFTYLIRRIPAWVALVPCLILLFFGSDHLHMLQGNGFIICFSLAMGLLALLMLEREDLKGDLVACAALVASVGTYSVGLPFIVAAGVGVLLARRWKSLWVPVVPALMYLAWYSWARQQDFSGRANEAQISNLTDLPEWAFQAAGAALYGLTGLSFDSSEGMAVDLIDARAAIISALAIAAVAWCIWKRRSGTGLWVALSAGVTLWVLQVLVTDAGGRMPDDARYLYPGAVICVLILAEAARGIEWRREGIVALYLIGLVGLFTNISLLHNNGDFYRNQGEVFRGFVRVADLIVQGRQNAGTAEAQTAQLDPKVLVTLPGGPVFAMAEEPYGRFASTLDEVKALPAADRERIDDLLVSGLQIELQPVRDSGVRGCRSFASDESAVLPRGGANLVSEAGVEQVRIGRFADAPQTVLGELEAGSEARLAVPEDPAGIPWRIAAEGGSVRVCRLSAGS